MELQLLRVRQPNEALKKTGTVALLDVMLLEKKDSITIPIMRLNSVIVKQSLKRPGTYYVSDGVLMRGKGGVLKSKQGSNLYSVKFFRYFTNSILKLYGEYLKVYNLSPEEPKILDSNKGIITVSTEEDEVKESRAK